MTMSEYDVIVIGGGINGLTCAAYLGRAGLKVLILEARGECGANCDACEPGMPGFVHNLHTTWMITGASPCMDELELESHGLEFSTTDVCYATTFSDGKNVCMNGSDPFKTIEYIRAVSPKDADTFTNLISVAMPLIDEVCQGYHDVIYTPPKKETMERFGRVVEGVLKGVGLNFSFEDAYNKMNGFDIMDMLFESEHVKSMLLSLSWISGLAPINTQIGVLGAFLAPITGMLIPVHISKGGGHGLTHALVKAAKHYGATILPCCPVEEIIVENGVATGVRLSDISVYPGKVIKAKKIVSNLTVVPTFIEMMRKEHIDPGLYEAIKQFSYEEQNIFSVHYALKGQPEFASAGFNRSVQRCCMGYFGSEKKGEMKKYNENLVNGVIHDEILANWFIPTLADPTQAPPGCHTAFAWFDVPPSPKAWKNRALNGFEAWDTIKHELADEVTEQFEKHIPGFKKLILDRIIYTPMDMFKNNPSSIKGNWAGGSVIPEQWYEKRPVPGVLKKGRASRTFIENLYISNSIHPYGGSHLSCGYMAASEVAEDMGVRNQSWWNKRAMDWHLQNSAVKVPVNLGVDSKWKSVE
jgi:phytoene dehydrogenase-like protein